MVVTYAFWYIPTDHLFLVKWHKLKNGHNFDEFSGSFFNEFQVAIFTYVPENLP